MRHIASGHPETLHIFFKYIFVVREIVFFEFCSKSGYERLLQILIIFRMVRILTFGWWLRAHRVSCKHEKYCVGTAEIIDMSRKDDE